jgi:hypothetical protein
MMLLRPPPRDLNDPLFAPDVLRAEQLGVALQALCTEDFVAGGCSDFRVPMPPTWMAEGQLRPVEQTDADSASTAPPSRVTRQQRTPNSGPSERCMPGLDTIGDLVGRVPCNLDKATVCNMVVVPRDMVRTAVYGASLLGCVDAVRGAESVDELLTKMMLGGVPLLVAHGRSSPGELFRKFKTVHHDFMLGCPVVLSSKAGILALLMPMGEPVCTLSMESEQPRGFLPPEMKNCTHPEQTAVEMWFQVVCVAKQPDFLHSQWHRNPTFRDFNWALDDKPREAGFKYTGNNTASTYLPSTSVLSRIFKETWLRVLDTYLGDYVAKLRALTGVPMGLPKNRKGRKRMLEAVADQPGMLGDPLRYVDWRRAVLLRSLVERSDSYGVARTMLAGILPRSILGDAPPGAFVPALHSFRVSDVRHVVVDMAVVSNVANTIRLE